MVDSSVVRKNSFPRILYIKRHNRPCTTLLCSSFPSTMQQPWSADRLACRLAYLSEHEKENPDDKQSRR